MSDVVLACREAWATDIKEIVVNSKAQSVMESRLIRATEHSSVKAGAIMPACDLQNLMILIYRIEES